MRKLIIASAIILSYLSLPIQAQLNGSGYYRAQNVSSGRYVSIIHNKSQSQLVTMEADLEATRTFKSWDMVSCDPSTIVYFDQTGTGTVANKPCKFFNLCGQGTSTMDIINFSLGVMDMGSNKYRCFARESGTIFYLGDEDSYTDGVGYLTSSGNSSNSNWNILPGT